MKRRINMGKEKGFDCSSNPFCIRLLLSSGGGVAVALGLADSVDCALATVTDFAGNGGTAFADFIGKLGGTLAGFLGQLFGALAGFGSDGFCTGEHFFSRVRS